MGVIFFEKTSIFYKKCIDNSDIEYYNNNEETDKDDEHMFMKMSAFFKTSQVDPIAE